jgi:hypothetical protein
LKHLIGLGIIFFSFQKHEDRAGGKWTEKLTMSIQKHKAPARRMMKTRNRIVEADDLFMARKVLIKIILFSISCKR